MRALFRRCSNIHWKLRTYHKNALPLYLSNILRRTQGQTFCCQGNYRRQILHISEWCRQCWTSQFLHFGNFWQVLAKQVGLHR